MPQDGPVAGQSNQPKQANSASGSLRVNSSISQSSFDRKRLVDPASDEGHSRKQTDLSLSKATAGHIRCGFVPG